MHVNYVLGFKPATQSNMHTLGIGTYIDIDMTCLVPSADI